MRLDPEPGARRQVLAPGFFFGEEIERGDEEPNACKDPRDEIPVRYDRSAATRA